MCVWTIGFVSRNTNKINKKYLRGVKQQSDCLSEVIGVTFLTPDPVLKKVTPAPAPVPELIGNLHSDSCLHCESLKAESILPHEVK